MQKETSFSEWFIAIILALAIIGIVYALVGREQAAPTVLSGASAVDQVFIDINADMPTAGLITAGPQADTLLVATNTGRLYLEVSNISTTSVGQVLYCNTNDRPVTVGKGIAIFASTTRTFNNLIGAIRCKYAAGSSSVAFLEK
jgi:hypothetical protein